jgi:cold shock CspA family protein
MKYFGTVKSFDVDKGIGSLKPETGGDDLHFERDAMSWDAPKSLNVGERLSYDKGLLNSQPCAVNLARI